MNDTGRRHYPHNHAMPDTTLRQLTMLQLVPRRSPGKTAQEIQEGLQARDFEINIRSVQRDLVRLSQLFPLASDEGHPARWFWADHAPEVSLPSQDPYSALTWQLIEDHLQPLLPRALRREAEPRFREAREYLEAANAKHLRRWKQRVRVVPRALELQPPEIRSHVLDALYDGLLEMRQVRVRYRRRTDQRANSMNLHPLALVFRDGVVYVLATVDAFSDVRQFVAHRLESAELTEEHSSEPGDFDLDEYIREGGFSFAEGERMRLVIRMESYIARHLLETPLSPDQTSRELDGDQVEIAATVLDSEQLRWWIKGFGFNMEVVEPPPLREELYREFKYLADAYERPPD